MRIPRPFRYILSVSLLAGVLALAWSAARHNDATLEIRATHAGASAPDGFFVWHHLDARGISVRSITPQNNILLVKFDSSAQSEAARQILQQALPKDYIVAAAEDNDLAHMLLSRLKGEYRRFG
ncbi:EnvZ/OmpR regulon moderator MzrA [Entomohabitans teleogrylli]|uniref:EnvZ/OmpR regulon moderator MzrA n=1 Tax=Entomohabitans teleogrylli TaxID=1384589 RepID=UPI00073D7920|nr:EnvZ/OmpR regulon moderator MzrA [Entomohabitans teleogrylli]